MRLSQNALQALERIKEKVNIKAYDFNRQELTYLSVVYFEITEQSRGKGLVLNLGCASCIPPAVNIVYNYLQKEDPAPEVKEINVTIDSWDDLTKAELWEQIRDREIEAPKTANKSKLIELITIYERNNKQSK
jgi:hypothetical protein